MGNNFALISAYLIKQSYFKLSNDRFVDFFAHQNEKPKEFNQNEFIELRTIGFGSIFAISLMFDIEQERIFAIKKPNIIDFEIPKLTKRE